MDLAHHMQPYPPVDAAVVWIEVVRVPLVPDGYTVGAIRILRIGGTECTLLISGRIVDLHCKYILLRPEVKCASDVDSVRVDSVLIQTNLLAIQINVACLTHTLKLDEDLLPGQLRRELKVLPVPRESFVRTAVAASMRNNHAERIDVIEAVRSRHRGPLRIVECRGFGTIRILTKELPVIVEVQRRARRFWRRECSSLARGRKCSIRTTEYHRQPEGNKRTVFNEFAARDIPGGHCV